MKNKTKRILSMVTAVAITASTFSAFAINASADEEIAVLQGVELLSEDFATVTGAWGFEGSAGAEIVDGVMNLADKTTANKNDKHNKPKRIILFAKNSNTAKIFSMSQKNITATTTDATEIKNTAPAAASFAVFTSGS